MLGRRFFPILFILLLFSSCGGKSGQVDQVFVIQGAIGLNASNGGGLFFAGRSNNGDEFRHGYAQPSSEISLTLPTGQWSFYAILWEGPGPMEGEHRCAITTADLASGDQTINLQLNMENCADSRIVSLDPALGGLILPNIPQFKNLQLHPCLTVNNVRDATDDCNGKHMAAIPADAHVYHGESDSYRVRLRSLGLNSSNPPRLTSRCLRAGDPILSTLAPARIETDLKLPIGGGANIAQIEILAYEGLACEDLMAIYQLGTPRAKEYSLDANGICYNFNNDPIIDPTITTQNACLAEGLNSLWLPSYFNNPQLSAQDYVYRLPPFGENVLYFADNFIGGSARLLQHKIPSFYCNEERVSCFRSISQVPNAMGYTLSNTARILEGILSNQSNIDIHARGNYGTLFYNYQANFFVVTNEPTDQYNGLEVLIDSGADFDIIYNPTGNGLIEIIIPATPIMTNDDIASSLNSFFLSQNMNITAGTDFGADEVVLVSPGPPVAMVEGRSPEVRRRLNSFVSDTAKTLAGPLMRAYEQSSGITSCEQIPTSGSFQTSINVMGGTFPMRIDFSPGLVAVPSWINGGNNFDKRLELSFNGELEEIIEFSCGLTPEGWVRHQSIYNQTINSREMFWSTPTRESGKIEIYHYRNENNNIHAHTAKLVKTGVQNFDVFISEASSLHNYYRVTKGRGGQDYFWEVDFMMENTPLTVTDIDDFASVENGKCFNVITSQEEAPSLCNTINEPLGGLPEMTKIPDWSSQSVLDWAD